MRKFILFLFSFTWLYAEQIYANFDVMPVQSAKLVFKSSGVISNINASISSTVKQGEILASLESSDEKLGLKNAKAELQKARVASEFASATFMKFKKVKDVTSQQRYEETKFNYENAMAELKRAQISVENAKNLLEKKQLRAPFDGVISAKFSEIGSGVLALNTPIFEILSYPEVKILLYIDEKHANSIKIGDEFKFKIAQKDGSAKITLIHPTIDTRSRKFIAEAITTGFKIGSFGEGFIVK
ncbi:efflux RND transporter periplasmic adaptor subunit [Campylobacter suis]|uniref:Cobalt-zinc-cadmium resistance protein CzcB n=1 Tax=Campylobacter suis TaxID=2790657 RepID=A0ABN7K2L2_9BACT|nr:efflux RND transporter periplasmic adaptor subunit [Campylobacter suis]CAD7286783.1 Cobalt-zinc-cadmium resistance protein CzcB [Campylobacter suis]